MSGFPAEYILKRSKRKTLAVEVTRAGEVIVRAPLRMPEREILRFLREQRQDRKSTRLNSSHITRSRMPSSA